MIDSKTKTNVKPSLLVLSVVFAITYFIYTDFEIKVRIGFAILIFSVCIALYKRLSRGLVVIGRVQQLYLLLSMSIVLMALLPYARMDHDLIAIIISLLLSCLFVIASCPTEKELSISMKIIVVSGILLSMYVFLIALFPNCFFLISKYISTTSRDYAQSMLKDGYGIFIGGSPVQIVYIVAFAIFVLVSRVALEPGMIKIGTLIKLAVLVFALLLENRKTELLATIIAATFLLLTKMNYTTAKKRRQNLQLFLSTAGVAVLSIPLIARFGMLDRYIKFIERIITNNNYGANIDISSGRFNLWSKAIELFASHPIFGIGWGRFSDYVVGVGYNFKATVNNVHNNYLQLLCETGILGFLIIVSLFIYILSETIKTAKTMNLYDVSITYRIAISSSIGFQVFMLLVSFLDPIWYKVVFWWFYSVAVLFTIGAKKGISYTKEQEK